MSDIKVSKHYLVYNAMHFESIMKITNTNNPLKMLGLDLYGSWCDHMAVLVCNSVVYFGEDVWM